VNQHPQTTASTAPLGSLLLDLKGAASFLGVTVWQVRGLIADKQLPVVRVGRKFYVRRASAIRWAERAEVRGKAA
jgi:excisionase family DNA binding protein